MVPIFSVFCPLLICCIGETRPVLRDVERGADHSEVMLRQATFKKFQVSGFGAMADKIQLLPLTFYVFVLF